MATKNFKTLEEETNYKHRCATKIKALWKGHKQRERFKLLQSKKYDKAAAQIQHWWRNYKTAKENKPLTVSDAAIKIQRLWRNYTNGKIFKYYKELIQFKFKGNPRDLLKTINPIEASMLDKASNVHLRFRLGGDKFPPLIYYKLYVHSGVCDVNSFAPRDYTAIKKATGKEIINMHLENEETKSIKTGWYERYDNNGWRPITDNLIMPFDRVELHSSNKPAVFHHDKLVRRELVAKQKRKRKIKWLKELYAEGRKIEEMEKEQEIENISRVDEEVEDEDPFREEKLIDLNEDDFDEYVNGLMKWSETLDFDKYMDHWMQIATSAPVENDPTETEEIML